MPEKSGQKQRRKNAKSPLPVVIKLLVLTEDAKGYSNEHKQLS